MIKTIVLPVIICLISLTKIGNAADSPSSSFSSSEFSSLSSFSSSVSSSPSPILEGRVRRLSLHEDVSDCQYSIPSIRDYYGLERSGNLGGLLKVFPKVDSYRIAIVGGSLDSGLGQWNKYCFDGIKPFYLINIKEEKGIDCLLDWTSPELPSDFKEQFHLIILEQIESSALTKTQCFVNAYQALKPGGILLFNTYRLSDFYIEAENALICCTEEEKNTLDMSALKILSEGIKMKSKANSRIFSEYFINRLRKVGFGDIKWNFSENLMRNKVLFDSELFRKVYFSKVEYNSGGWFEAHKKV